MKKNLTYLTLAVVLISATLSSCGKYEDGPGFSLLTKKARITGVWDEKEEVDTDGTVYTDNDDATMELTKSGSAILNSPSSGISIQGSWEFASNKEKVRITFNFGTNQTEEYTIRRLTNKELWVRDVDGYEYRYEKKK